MEVPRHECRALTTDGWSKNRHGSNGRRMTIVPMAWQTLRRDDACVLTPTVAQEVYDVARVRVSGSEIRLQVGDICASNAEILVSSDDSDLSMGGGVSQALLELAGPGLRIEARKHLPTRLGEVVVTSGGKSRASYILHGITLDYNRPLEVNCPGHPRSGSRSLSARSWPRPSACCRSWTARQRHPGHWRGRGGDRLRDCCARDGCNGGEYAVG